MGIFLCILRKILLKGGVFVKMSSREYNSYVQELSPKSKSLKNCLNAFWVGGLICALGQLFINGFQALDLGKELSGTATSICLVLLSAVLTGFAVYDDIAKFAGAGTLVPITGFANSVVAPAVEFQSENFINGVGSKMFIIAGPVIVYGVTASVIYGLIYWLTQVI